MSTRHSRRSSSRRARTRSRGRRSRIDEAIDRMRDAARAYRLFAAWCEEQRLDPDTTGVDDIERYIEELARRRRRPKRGRGGKT